MTRHSPRRPSPIHQVVDDNTNPLRKVTLAWPWIHASFESFIAHLDQNRTF